MHVTEVVAGWNSRRWLETRRERILDDLASELAPEMAAVAHDRDALMAKLTRARDEGWPVEQAGYWVAGARRAGASWAEVAARLGLSRQSATRQFSCWEERFAANVATPCGNLPTPMTGFVGRVGERAEVARVMSACRLVTLTGPAGVGKSRLALRVVSTLASSHPDGAWWVDLAAVPDSALVPQAVADCMSVTEQSGGNVTASLTASLRVLSLIIVLDNCEHLVGGCAALATALLRACPGVSVLATSRRPLGVAGEATWLVPPLALPLDAPGRADENEAVELFCQRAVIVQPGFVLDRASASSVAEICRRLDGLPLAIELAAAQVRYLSPTDIAARLGDRLTLLTGGVDSTESHHRSLVDALDWSHDLLPVSHRVLLRRLAVFPGPFPLDAAETVCVGGELRAPDVLELLRELVARSLVVADTNRAGVRYHLLETIRLYASERLTASGEESDLEALHTGWCLRRVEAFEPELVGSDQRLFLERMSEEHASYRSALGWAVTQGEAETCLALAGGLTLFWRMRGHFSEGRHWLGEALALTGQGSSDGRAKALWGLGFLSHMAGDQMGAVGALREALVLAQAHGDDRLSGRCLLILGNTTACFPPLDTLAMLQESVALARRCDDSWCLAHALALAGQARSAMGRPADGRPELEESIAVARQAGDAQGLRIGLLLLGDHLVATGDWARAEELIVEGLELTRQLAEPYGVAVALSDLARLAVGRGEWERAEKLLAESVEVARRSASPGLVADIHCQLGRLAQSVGDTVAANRHFGSALTADATDELTIAVAIEGLGEVAAASGDLIGARNHFDRVLGRLGEAKSRLTARVLYQLGELARLEHDQRQAWELHQQSLRVRADLGDRAGLADSFEALAVLAAERRRNPLAARLAGTGDALRTAVGCVPSPSGKRALDAQANKVRARMGSSRFDAAWAAGAAAPLGDAVARALGSSVAPAMPAEGPAPLTVMETQVCDLAAQGLTNPEIGARLFISRHTVRCHLSAAFVKLRISSRSELPGALPRPDI